MNIHTDYRRRVTITTYIVACLCMSVPAVADAPRPFTLSPAGSFLWPGQLHIYKSSIGNALPDLEDGAKRARPGGSLVVQPLGDYMRSAIDILPTSAKPPEADALAEITLHRITPSATGFEMMSISALATETLPFGIIVENGGAGKQRPFIFLRLSEDTAFQRVSSFAEPIRLTEDGAAQFGRRRGRGPIDRVLADDPGVVDQTSRDAIVVERQDPSIAGRYDSDSILLVGKERSGSHVSRQTWRINVHSELDEHSSLVIRSGDKKAEVAVRDNGDVEMLKPSGALVMMSPDGARWRLTVNNSGELKAVAAKK